MTSTTLNYTILTRGLIHVAGPDSDDFLQGLISQDINLLKTQPIIYGALLSPQGKFLHDFFIQNHGNGYVIDCEAGARRDDLIQRLTQYRLRAKISIAPLEGCVIAGLSAAPHDAVVDPRHPKIGWRIICFDLARHPDEGRGPYQKEFFMDSGLRRNDALSFKDWDENRIRLSIPDGSRDAEIGSSTLEELNITRLNGVSFTKGCYVGQELTARMHNLNKGKRHLQTVRLDALPDGAELRSSCGDVGLALVRTN